MNFTDMLANATSAPSSMPTLLPSSAPSTLPTLTALPTALPTPFELPIVRAQQMNSWEYIVNIAQLYGYVSCILLVLFELFRRDTLVYGSRLPLYQLRCALDRLDAPRGRG